MAISMHSYRGELWERLQRTALIIIEPWLMLGNFNPIMNNTEKIGGHPLEESTFCEFNTILKICNMAGLKLLEIYLVGMVNRSVVRNGQRTNELIQCCLDRALANTE